MTEMNLATLLAKEVDQLSVEELNFIVGYEKRLRAVHKVAKEKGIVVKDAAKTEKSPEIQLLATAFEAVLSANLDVIKGLFPVSADKPAGAKGVNVATSTDFPFYIQILNRAAFKHDAEIAKAAKEANKEKKEESGKLPL